MWCQGQSDDLYAQTQRSQGSFRGCVSSGTLDINKWLTEIKQNFTSWNLSTHFSSAHADRNRALEFTEDPCQQPIDKVGLGWRHMKHLCVLTSDLLKLAHFWNSLWVQELLTSHTGEQTYGYLVFKCAQSFLWKPLTEEGCIYNVQVLKMMLFFNQKLSQYLFDWKRNHFNPSSMSLLSLKEITQICNKSPSISFLGLWARCCKLVTENSLHFTHCELFFFHKARDDLES